MDAHAPDHMKLSITRSPDSTVDFVQIRGDVDLSNSGELGLAASQLIGDEASIIYVDLGGVTFIGSTLVTFLAHACRSSGNRRPIVVCRPTPMALRVIRMTGLDEFASVRPDLPPLWPHYGSDPGLATHPRGGATGEKAHRVDP
jgi:anti-anti-sigma factor